MLTKYLPALGNLHPRSVWCSVMSFVGHGYALQRTRTSGISEEEDLLLEEDAHVLEDA